MKKIVLLSVCLFLCSPLHIAGSAAVGGPVKGNENAKQVQENFALFTPEELAQISNADFLDKIAVDSRGKQHIDEVRDFAQRYFEFSLYPRPFKRGEIVVIPRSDLTYRYGIVLGRLKQEDIYVVQLNGQGNTKGVKDEYIGRLKAGAKPVLNSIIPGEKKPEVEKQVMGGAGAGAGAGSAGNAAVGGPVCAHGNIKEACEGVETPFTIQELDQMVLYYPYEFMRPTLGVVADGSIFSGWCITNKDKLRLLGYSFSSNYTFRRGERVLWPLSLDPSLEDWEKRRYDSMYDQGVIFGYDATKRLYGIQSMIESKHKIVWIASEELGKYKLLLDQTSSHMKNQTPFTQAEFGVLPVPYQASSIINEIAVHGKHAPIVTGGGKARYVDWDLETTQRHFNFSPQSTFERGELVIVPRSDFHYRYGIVMDCLGADRYRVQVTKEGLKKEIHAQNIGKLKLDFSLLDRTPEEKMEIEKSMLAGMQAKTPEVLQLISEMGGEYDPAAATPIAKIKDAIRDNDMKKLQEALGSNNQYLEAADETGYTPLLFAIYFNNSEAVDLLLEKGANPGKKAAIGHTKEKDSKKELDAYCLAQVLAKGNHKYDAVLARLELYKLENNIKDTSCAGDIKVVETPAAAQQRTGPPGGISLPSDTK